MQFKINDTEALNVTRSKQGQIVHLQHLQEGKWVNVHTKIFALDWNGNMVQEMQELYKSSQS